MKLLIGFPNYSFSDLSKQAIPIFPPEKSYQILLLFKKNSTSDIDSKNENNICKIYCFPQSKIIFAIKTMCGFWFV
jgi:hypothetical protein